MGLGGLSTFITPKSLAVIGASDQTGSVGSVLMDNVLKFNGMVYPVNPRHGTIHKLPSFSSVAALPEAPDLAIIATPANAVPQVLTDLGQKGTKAVVIISAGFGEGADSQGSHLKEQILGIAKRFNLRMIGPNCLGIQVPAIGLNASFDRTTATPGEIALITQSGAMATAIADWANSRNIGFSHVLSLGDMIDVDFADAMELVASDQKVKAILLYMESITNAQKFMRIAKDIGKHKPIVAIKAGRSLEGARAASSHTGSLAGSDEVYSAAFRRVGILRVNELEELFEAVETLSKIRLPNGEALAILTNGGGAGVLAVDSLIAKGGHLAKLSSSTIKQLDSILPPTWSHANPIDIIGDASADRYEKALKVALNEENVDAVLVLNCPTAIVDSSEVAEKVISCHHDTAKTIIVSWLGGASTEKSRQKFEAANMPFFDTPNSAVRAFQHLVDFRHARQFLSQPQSVCPPVSQRASQARDLIQVARRENRQWLSEIESKKLLSFYNVPTTAIEMAQTCEDAQRFAYQLAKGSSIGVVALKIQSPDLLHKSEVGGVMLNLKPEDVARAAETMRTQVLAKSPDARITGFVVEEMIHQPNGYELIIGVHLDSQFGPVVLFGEGGIAVEVVQDTVMDLVPIDLPLAHRMISRTRISRKLQGFRNQPAVNFNAIAESLVAVSQMVCELPEITDADFNPLIASPNGVVVVDARVKIQGQNSL